jgi:hypothetical protein
MLIASLLRHAGSQVAQGLKSQGGGASGGTQASRAFKSLKGAITSGNSSKTQVALSDIRKLLASAGSIGAANSVQNQLNSIGAALKSGSSSGGHAASSQAGRSGPGVKRF